MRTYLDCEILECKANLSRHNEVKKFCDNDHLESAMASKLNDLGLDSDSLEENLVDLGKSISYLEGYLTALQRVSKEVLTYKKDQ